MMLWTHKLNGMRVAILVTDGFNQDELMKTRHALDDAGAETMLVSTHLGMVQGFVRELAADSFYVDLTIDQANPDLFDALVLSGGIINSDGIKNQRHAQLFVQQMDAQDKPVGVINQGACLLVQANLVQGRLLTSSIDLQNEIRAGGGRWLDLPVVTDRNWVSSRGSIDLPIFIRTMLLLFKEYWQERQLQLV